MQTKIELSATKSRTQDFFRETVEPTVNEFLADKTNIRRGRLAAIVLSHMVDYWCVDNHQKDMTPIRKDLATKTPIDDYSFFQAVWDVSDASKHV